MLVNEAFQGADGGLDMIVVRKKQLRSCSLLLVLGVSCTVMFSMNLRAWLVLTALKEKSSIPTNHSILPPKKAGAVVPAATSVTMPTRYNRPKGIHPSNSTPPESIKLFETSDVRIHKRHECIAKIRERIRNQLTPFIQTSFETQREPLLVDPALHPNVGDHMLVYGETNFLRSLGFHNPAMCSIAQASSYCQQCIEYLRDQNPKLIAQSNAYWHAGGNWGDLYPRTQQRRIPSFTELLKANYSIVSMPQSFYYQSDQNRVRDTRNLRASIADGLGFSKRELVTNEQAKLTAASRVTLTWREATSFEKANKEYPFATHVLVPDIAFFLGPFLARPSLQKDFFQLDILLFLREDKESVLSSSRNNKSIRGVLDSILGGDGLRFGIADWNTRFAMWPSDDYLFTESAIQLLSLGRVVICDRLHAAILCYLTGIPFVYIDQSTGKISKTLGVAFDSWEGCQDSDTAMWAQADSIEEALGIAVSFLERYNL